MPDVNEQDRKAAVRSLINIAILEGAVLVAVIAVFLYTNNIVHLFGGAIGSAVIFTPMFLRWSRAHGPAFKSKPNSSEGGHG